jgi:phenylpropionate dioxygenase-like ring-hydroxylating dioxygenase large terminal subunit
MGNLMREYWIPALLASELPRPDSDPVRVLLLGERLIAFRDSNGSIGLLQNNCPHRGASLFFGRNEASGLRCVYHGWKFDVTGGCVDMPNEPAESDFKHKVTAVAYPTCERGGVIWAYMGPRPEPPPLPDLEANMLPEGEYVLSATQRECNWLQTIEGDIDTSHAGFLHSGGVRPEEAEPGTFRYYMLADRAPKYAVLDTDVGVTYGGYRDARPGHEYWRIAQFMFPFYAIPPAGVLGHKVITMCRVPMDDGHTLNITMAPRRGRRIRAAGGPDSGLLPNTTDWYGRFRLAANGNNDYQIDRDLQRHNTGPDGYTGIHGVNLQDQAITESMGPIYDRSTEHLGTSDTMIIRVRRRLLNAVRAHAEQAITPPGVDDPRAYHQRGGGVFLPKGVDWVAATAELRKAFVNHPELDLTVAGEPVGGAG